MTALDVVEEIAELVLAVAALYFALHVYVTRKSPDWARRLGASQTTILLVLIFAVTGVKITQDVLGKKSGPVDELVLRFLHAHVPGAFTAFFEAVTFTGSWRVIFPLVCVTAVGLVLARRRFEALLIAVSVASGALLVYGVKAALGRARPDLWEAEWYWGSSFPSGHTLVVTAFATAVALCVRRIVPQAYRYALTLAVAWSVLVGLSRLILGVHWPSDVVAAWCIGALLPIAVSTVLGRTE